MRDNDLAAKAAGMLLAVLLYLAVGIFVAIFKKPKIMIPILVLSGIIVYFFKEQGTQLAFMVCVVSGFFLSMPYRNGW